MYEVSSLSIAIMEKLINYPKKIDDSVKRLIQGKKYFLKLMKNLKFNGFDTYGNFLFIDFGEYSKIINESLQKNILIRNNFSHDSLKNYTRFSATTKKNYYSIYKHIIKILKTHNLLL